jgi:hypothetical protein
MKPHPKPTKQPKTNKRRPKSERRVLETKLDWLLSVYVRRRDGACVICGATTGLTAGHWITRRKKRIRWDHRNVAAQCRSCNLAHNFNHQFYDMWMLKYRGAEVMRELTELSTEKAWKFTVDDLRDMVAQAEERLEALS